MDDLLPRGELRKQEGEELLQLREGEHRTIPFLRSKLLLCSYKLVYDLTVLRVEDYHPLRAR